MGQLASEPPLPPTILQKGLLALKPDLPAPLGPPLWSARKPNHQPLVQLFEVTSEWPVLIRPWLGGLH